MPEPDTNRLQRAFKGLTIGVIDDLTEKQNRLLLDGLQEIEQQFWIEFSGRAEEFASFSEREIEFEQRFVDATGQRDSPFDRPHFTFGAVIDSSTPVMVSAVVMAYRTNERNEVVGARIAIGVAASDISVNVRGRVNLTFQGYGQAPSGIGDDIGAEG